MTQSLPTPEPDLILVYNASYQPEHCELVELRKHTVRLKHPDGLECVYSTASGRPHAKFDRHEAFRRYHIQHGELRRLKALFVAGNPKAMAPSVTDQIVRHLMERSPLGRARNCPVSGDWIPFAQVSIALGDVTDKPGVTKKYGPNPGTWSRRRVDVAFVETQRRKAFTQFRLLAVEVKQTRADFKGDDKWSEYRERFHGLMFAAPPGVVELEDLPREVGLWHWNGAFLERVRYPTFLEELPVEVLADTYRGLALAGSRGEE